MSKESVSVLLLLHITILAVDWLALCWLEWHFAFIAAL
jgi:hypothetical protein